MPPVDASAAGAGEAEVAPTEGASTVNGERVEPATRAIHGDPILKLLQRAEHSPSAPLEEFLPAGRRSTVGGSARSAGAVPVGEPPTGTGPYEVVADLRPIERDVMSLMLREFLRNGLGEEIALEIERVDADAIVTSFAASPQGPTGTIRFRPADVKGNRLLEALLPLRPHLSRIVIGYRERHVRLRCVIPAPAHVEEFLARLLRLDQGAAILGLYVNAVGNRGPPA